MRRRGQPRDEGAVSVQQRAEMEALRQAGQPLDLAFPSAPPSRSKLGKLLDFFESLARSGRG